MRALPTTSDDHPTPARTMAVPDSAQSPEPWQDRCQCSSRKRSKTALARHVNCCCAATGPAIGGMSQFDGVVERRIKLDDKELSLARSSVSRAKAEQTTAHPGSYNIGDALISRQVFAIGLLT